MADYHIVRGTEILWRVRFLDSDKNPVSPPSATFYVSYKSNGEQTRDSVPMTGEPDGQWIAQWDSASADPGFVFWHARCDGDTPSATEGRIVLVANDANPGPA